LYEKVDVFFKGIVTAEEEALRDLRGDYLLRDYLQRFNNYTAASSKIKNIFAYMHRYWIPNQVTNGDNSVRNIYDLSLINWRQVCYVPLKGFILDALISLVTEDRKGNIGDKSIVKNMVKAYIDIGVMEEQAVNFYKIEFETPFVNNTMDFYIQESEAFLQSNSVSAYMEKAEDRLAQEADLAQQYLHPTSFTELKKAVEKVLIERHMTKLQEEFQSMLRDDKYKDMTRFYNLLSRILNGLNNSSNTLKQYLTNVGMGVVKEQSSKLQSKQAVSNSINLINSLLALHKKYADIIKQCFQDHKLFVQAMDEAFTKFINVEVGAFTMAELLNFYVDHLFKGNEKLPEDQLEDTTESVVRLFTYFDDKDLFYAAFRRSLSKRLLSRKINEDAERNFIAKLKRRCGEVYTKKLEGMFNDIKISTEKKR